MIVADAEERLVIVPRVIVVVAKVDVPDTARVPLDTNDEVAVIEPPVRVLMVPVIADKTEVKRLVLVLLSRTAFVA